MPAVHAQPQAGVGVWLGAAGLALAAVGAVLACIEATAPAGWIIAAVGLLIGVGALLGTRVPRPLGAATAVIAAVGLVAGLVLDLTVYQGDDAPSATPAPLYTGDTYDPGTLGTAPVDDETASVDAAELPPMSVMAPKRGPGSDAEPLSFGVPVELGNWELTAGEPYEAGDQIENLNPFNEPPPEGFEYWIIPVTATNLADEPSWAGVELRFRFAQDGGMSPRSCPALIPDGLTSRPESAPGETVSGNMCGIKPVDSEGMWVLTVDFRSHHFFA